MITQLPALRFEVEAFELGKSKVLGRQSAGHGFLRALLKLPELEELVGYGPRPEAGDELTRVVSSMRSDVRTRWVSSGAEQDLANIGGVHFPDPLLAEAARARMSFGCAAWSITGITHTICSRSVMAGIADYALAPLMEWDGLILTSDAVKASVMEILDEQESYVNWRFPGAKSAVRPQLPVIPLGVHCADFTISNTQRADVRQALDIDCEEIVFLYVGRLSLHAKANPWPMYKALEEAANRTGRKVTLLQCGWFANVAIEESFKRGAEVHSPSVRHLWLDGRDEKQRNQAWAAGDIFVSLSDNIQETFGLTPLEAMAAGMPVLVSDWNGYRQTVRNGETGIMVPTFGPASDASWGYANAYASGAIGYDYYLAQTARHISMDLAALFDAAETLVNDADKRRAMGEAGRRLAQERFDWSIIIRQYLALWEELALIRKANVDNPNFAPKVCADRLDPFRLFAGYPSQIVDQDFRIRVRQGDFDISRLLDDPLLSLVRPTLPDERAFAALFTSFQEFEGSSLGDAAHAAGISGSCALQIATVLMKIGVIESVDSLLCHPPNRAMYEH